MRNYLTGKNRKVFTAGLALLLTSALIMILLTGSVLATNDGQITRLFGANRWETSATVALAAYPGGSDNVIIARGDDAGGWADGLAGGYLAGVLDAPILLTAPNTLPAAVSDAIVDLGAQKAYILGGTAAVSAEVEAELETLVTEVERIFGANREETAAHIAKRGDIADNTAFVVQGFAPADSMVAGAAAFAKGYPILLVYRDSIPVVTEEAIVELSITDIIIVGGEDVVSAGVETGLAGIDGVVSVSRLYGKERDDTSLKFAEEQFPDCKDFSIVNGWRGLADAVGASVFGNPILYVRTDTIPTVIENHLIDFITCESMIYIFGGGNVVSASVAAELQAIKDAAVCFHTVTFAEQNELAGVAIQVYSDAERTVAVGDALATDVNGQATIDLENGEYWYNATLGGYVDYEGDFTVTGAAKTVAFTMVAEVVEYTVTFVEQTNLAGVVIQVYSDAERTVAVGDALTTDSSGQASIELEDGAYWYNATLEGYVDYEGDFTVAGAAKTVAFTMVEGVVQNQFFTDFSEYTTDAIPEDWIETYGLTAWRVAEVDGGKVLRNDGSVGALEQPLAWNKPGQTSILEIYGRGETSINNSSSLELFGMAQVGELSGYRIDFRPNEDDVRFRALLNGAFQGTARTFAFEHSTNEELCIRARFENYDAGGTAMMKVSIKVWKAADAEPVEWNEEFEVSSLFSTGYAGVYMYKPRPTATWHEFGVGIGGAAAPVLSE